MQALTPDQLGNLAVTNVKLPENGYLYVYVCDESAMDVYFDNLQIIHYTNPLTEVNDYYPFGLLAKTSTSLGGTLQNYKYNGKELQRDLAFNVEDYGARQYDPVNGRWLQVDPLSEIYRNWSPYHYAVDNPVRYIDPDGMASTYNWDKKRYEDENGKEISWGAVCQEYGIDNTNTNNESSSSNNQGSTSSSNKPQDNNNQPTTNEKIKEITGIQLINLSEKFGKFKTGKEVIDFINAFLSTNPSALVTGSTLSKYIKNITDDARKSLNGINTVTLQNSNNISLSTFNSEKIKINLLPGLNLKISDGATFNFKTLNTNKITIEISGIDVGFLGLNKVEINQTSITINIGLFSKTFELK